jgi:hypothetical protein
VLRTACLDETLDISKSLLDHITVSVVCHPIDLASHVLSQIVSG